MIALASLRPRQWSHFAALPLAGVTCLPCEWPRALLGVAIASACLACAYGINAAAERHTDRSVHKNPLVAAPGVGPLAVVCSLTAAALALLLALPLGPQALLACAASLICGVHYSVGLAAKRYPVLGLLLNAGIFAPLMALLIVPGRAPPSLAHELALFILLLLQNQLIHELADRQEDRAAGARTTAQWLRGRGTVRVAVIAGSVIPPMSLALAPTAAQALLAAVLAAITTTLALTARRDPARARARHRQVACAGGALLWLLARLI